MTARQLLATTSAADAVAPDYRCREPIAPSSQKYCAALFRTLGRCRRLFGRFALRCNDKGATACSTSLAQIRRGHCSAPQPPCFCSKGYITPDRPLHSVDSVSASMLHACYLKQAQQDGRIVPPGPSQFRGRVLRSCYSRAAKQQCAAADRASPSRSRACSAACVATRAPTRHRSGSCTAECVRTAHGLTRREPAAVRAPDVLLSTVPACYI